MITETITFPSDFLWGTATSAHQVEGDNRNNQWWAWEQQPGRIWRGDRSGGACGWWMPGGAEADLDLAAEMGQKAHRLSVEWSRIEPSEGMFDRQAIARYRQILQAMRERGIEPMVTLHHFTDPLWVAHSGGWENPGIIERFRRFVRYTVGELGDLVRMWCTINEPNIYVAFGYIRGVFPPGRRHPIRALQVLNHMLRAHAAAYRTIHQMDGQAQVGLAHHIAVFEPADSSSALDRLMATVHDHVFNAISLYAPHDGIIRFPAGTGLVYGPLLDSQDFIGVNYYVHYRVRFDPSRRTQGFARYLFPPGAPLTDIKADGEPYSALSPEGFYRALRRAAQLRKPIFITENGCPDAADRVRPRLLATYLPQVHRALREGADIRGYFHWTLVDNFEWADGWGLRFGLIELDVPTGQRRIRPSGYFYREVARANALTPEMVARYAPELSAYPTSA
ncbi:MAG: glycoside hydrolase family 1 protein [Anaerolineae bacterium]|nr:glycoside hydrolase family 1 protein [Anaerolineae bacterium]MDW8098172.1 glycoside hydrolase family 1 protein [Anaerolineae bacterium]